jgi:hypothetical protein
MGREKSMYQAWRLFESADEFMPGRVCWHYYGLELPAPFWRVCIAATPAGC